MAELLAAGKGNELVLLAARRGERLVGAVLSQRLPGRCAVVWPPQVVTDEPPATAVGLLDELHSRLVAGDIHLVQALLESPTVEAAQPLGQAGYFHAGDLLYMVAEAARFPAEISPLPMTLEPWSPENDARLARVIEATYRGSLDCPLVDGLRSVEDVLAGYRAVGQFRPELWLLVREGEADAGCLLLADHHAQHQWEIVYLGLIPEVRGRGWGLALTKHAQALARQAGRDQLVLAVDAANQPAVSAYSAAGFAGWDRRSVFVRRLTK